VHEVFHGKTVWKGEVEVFGLYGHAQATVCYGWAQPEEKDNKGERFVTVLQMPPVISPETAVRASIVADSRREK